MDINEEITAILSGDNDAFEAFQNKHKGIVFKYVNKWQFIINKTSLNMYDAEDITQEVWMHILNKLHTYDSEKGAISTWLSTVCDRACQRIKITQSYQYKYPGNDEETKMASLNTFVGSEEDSELIDFIMDPQQAFSSFIESEELVFHYVYLIAQFIKTMDRYNHRIIYMHQIKGLTLRQSASILGITHERIRQIREKIAMKLSHMKMRYEKGMIDMSQSFDYSMTLMSDLSDEDLVEKLNEDFAVIKISRQVLEIAELYNSSQEVTND